MIALKGLSFNIYVIQELIQYTESSFKEQKISVRTKTMVKEVKDKVVVVKNEKGEIEELPYGLLVWAAVSNLDLSLIFHPPKSYF